MKTLRLVCGLMVWAALSLRFLGFSFDMNSNPQGSKVFGNSKTVDVENAVTVDEVARWFTDQLTVDATVNVAASGYSIEVYDLASGNLLKTLSGSISGGKIETGWDLNDNLGNRVANGPLRCDFYLTSSQQPNVQGASPNAAPYPSPSQMVFKYAHPINGQSFTVAYGFDYFYSYRMAQLQNAILSRACPKRTGFRKAIRCDDGECERNVSKALFASAMTGFPQKYPEGGHTAPVVSSF